MIDTAGVLGIIILLRSNKSIPSIIKSLSLTDIFVIFYAILCILSYFISPYRDAVSVWGFGGWNMGLLTQLMLVAIYFIASRLYEHRPYLPIAVISVAIVVYAIGMLQRLGYNPFGLYDGLELIQKQEFLTTIGQTTWYSSYAILILPIGVYLYMSAEKWAVRALAFVFIVTQAGMLCTTYCDSAFIGAFVGLFVLSYAALSNPQMLLRFLEALILMLLVFLIVGICHSYYPDMIIGGMYDSAQVTYTLTDYHVVAPILILFVLFYGVATYGYGTAKWDITKYRKIIWRTLLTIATVGLFICIISIIVITSSHMRESGLFAINDSWGNNRGFIWRIAIDVYHKGSILTKLFGTGPDTFFNISNTYYQSEIQQLFGDIKLANAHNEWLNMLVTSGILGLIAYCGVFICTLHENIKKSNSSAERVVLIAIISSYIAFNIFCYQQCISTPVIFLIIGIASKSCKES